MRKSGVLKKGIAAFMTVCMVMAAGCGANGNIGKSSSKDADNGEEVTIRVMVWDRGNAAPGTTTENNTLTDWIKKQMKDQYNINVEYVSVPRSSSDDKLNIMMSGGTAPDIVFTYDQSIFYNYASNGGLADLTEAYNEYGGTIRENLGNIQEMGVLDGVQYGIMKERGVESPRHTAYIRKDWLQELGMDIPTTKKELGEYLTAVKEKNPGAVSDVIPWGMSGRNDTEKGYLNFVGSYVDLESERDAYIYNESYMAVAPGAVDGIRQLNEWYNQGLLSKDFATDTTEDIYKAQVSAGNVGFVLDDTSAPWELTSVLNSNLGHETFIPIQCFELEDGSYRTPFEPRFGMFIMVPKSSEDKVDACMKYLNWQADPQIAENIEYSPDHQQDENGVPKALTESELQEKGYPGTCADLCIVTQAFDWTKEKDAVVSNWYKSQSSEWADEEWFENYYDVREKGKYVFPTYSYVSSAESDYGSNVKSMMIEYVYKLISCPTEEFEALQQTEYNNLVAAGLDKILDARAEYYDSLS